MRRLLALLLAAGCASALTGARRLQPARAPALARAPRRCARVALTANADEGERAPAAAADDAPPAPTGFLAKLKGSLKFDRKSLAKLGSSMILSYGFVSNVNAGFLIVISWATFRAANPALSPLSFETGARIGQWVLPALAPKFLVVYGGYYATVGTLLRPVRFAVAAALGPSFTNLVKWLKERFGMPQGVAVGIVVLLANFVTTWLIIVFGVKLACAIVGVPVFPAPAA